MKSGCIPTTSINHTLPAMPVVYHSLLRFPSAQTIGQNIDAKESGLDHRPHPPSAPPCEA